MTPVFPIVLLVELSVLTVVMSNAWSRNRKNAKEWRVQWWRHMEDSDRRKRPKDVTPEGMLTTFKVVPARCKLTGRVIWLEWCWCRWAPLFSYWDSKGYWLYFKMREGRPTWLKLLFLPILVSIRGIGWVCRVLARALTTASATPPSTSVVEHASTTARRRGLMRGATHTRRRRRASTRTLTRHRGV